MKRNVETNVGEVYYENSYRITPEKDERFSKENVERIVRVIVEKELKGKKYSEKTALQYSRLINKSIIDTIKEYQGYPRYKIIAQVTVSERDGHGMRVSSRCLWNTADDNYASVVYENETMVCVAMVFGIFYE